MGAKTAAIKILTFSIAFTLGVPGGPGGIPVAPYHGLYATIRSVNQRLPKDRRLRVLCGDPPIDWTRVQTRDDIIGSTGPSSSAWANTATSVFFIA